LADEARPALGALNRGPVHAARVRTAAFALALAAGLAGLAGLAGEAHAVEVMLIGRDLRARPASLVTLRPRAALIADDAGREQSVPFDRLSAIVPVSWWQAEETDEASVRRVELARSAAERGGWGVLELTDGQRLTGRLIIPGAGEAPSPDWCQWESPLFGRVRVKLDQIRRLRMEGFASPSVEPLKPSKNDTVLLSNGDVVSGFVESIAEQVLIKADVQTSPIAPQRVRELRLANPAEAPKGARLWLSDGTVLRLDRVGDAPPPAPGQGEGANAAISDEVIYVTPAGIEAKQQAAVVAGGRFRAFLPEARRVIGLSSLPVEIQRPAPDRPGTGELRTLRSPGDYLDAADLELPGPMSVEWSLPADAQRLGGWAVLPETAREWGDCVLTISLLEDDQPATELARATLNASSPIVRLDIALPAAKSTGPRRLGAKVDAGRFGPIQDRVVLRRVVLVRGS
jgi:hypothetical protein